jgi:hypothetical protein
MADVTQYAMATDANNAPGDLYVEGTSNIPLALTADNDVVITNSLAPSSSAAGIEVIAKDNVRVYHPVSCVATDSTTTVGFCPNDITGLYTGVLASGARPDQQYTNLRTDLGNLNINAAVFALGTATSTLSCPQPTGATTATCDGEFTVDNYNRGDSIGTTPLGAVTVTGTLSQVHHGAVGQEWEIPNSTGQTSRPYSGYQLNIKYQNLQTVLSPFTSLLNTTSSTSSQWRVVSVSTAAN